MLNPQKNKIKTHQRKAGSSHLCDAGGSRGGMAGACACGQAGPKLPAWVLGTRKECWLKRVGLNHIIQEGRRPITSFLESGQHPSPPSGCPVLYPAEGTPKAVPSPLPPPVLLSRPLPGHLGHQGPIQVLLRWEKQAKQACS